MRRAYHNLTSHYNVFWNGQYSLNEGDQQLKRNAKDDYSKVLPVFNYGTKSEALSLNSQMDRALQKTAICVQKHSMKFNNRERVKWIDDAYLVMAKAHFYKQDYIPAKRTFDFVTTEFKNSDVALIANLWQIKTYIKTEEYPKAIAMIEQLQNKTAGMKKLPKELYRNFDLTVADYYIATKEYGKAIDYLKAGILQNNNRDVRTRAMFILGQIYMELGEAKRATEQFRKVIKRNPAYEMLFESKMNMAKMGSSGNAKELYKMLNRMLDDLKNEEFRDRIYYAMAELAIREGDLEKAIGYYRESVAAATNNRIQRANAALKVATIYFDRNDYELSQAYYDTAVSSMDKNTTPGYDSIYNISQTLNELVQNLTVVKTQDSLIKVANMDSVARNILIDKIIAEVIEQEKREEEQRKYEEQMALMGSAIGTSNVNNDNGRGNSGAWYFYNETTLQSGYNDFSKKWGMRKLEDNWRISDKRGIHSGVSETVSTDSEGVENDSLSKSYTNHDRGYYIKDLPLTEEQQQEAHHQIAEALYNTGFIYLDRLSDYPRSIDAYETLDRRYPGNDKELPSWYALYKMYHDQHDEVNAEKYRQLIFSKYPDSNYASVILDPDFYKKLQEESQQASDLYSKTYEAYRQGQYYRVKMNADRALEDYASDTALAPRFALLSAISRGRLETVDTMAYALMNVVRTYPNSSIRPYAQSLLQHVNDEYHLGLNLGDLASADASQKQEKLDWPYVKEPNSPHLVLIVFDSKKVRVEPLKVRLSDFNKKEFRFKNFEVKTIVLEGNTMVVSLSQFENEQEAKDYIAAMTLSDYLFGGMDKDSYSVLPISLKNYPIFYQERDVDGYKAFLNGEPYKPKAPKTESKTDGQKQPAAKDDGQMKKGAAPDKKDAMPDKKDVVPDKKDRTPNGTDFNPAKTKELNLEGGSEGKNIKPSKGKLNKNTIKPN
jgi:tetratricopeptide (TPR) repeat protein